MRPLLSFLVIALTTMTAIGQDLSWYKLLKGTVGKYPVTVHLHKFGHGYSGFYYYESQQQPVYFIGDDTTVKGQIRLIAFLPDRNTDENFTFAITDSVASGKWKNSSSKNELEFQAISTSDQSLQPFQYVYTEGSLKLRPAISESPAATYQASSLWPMEASPKFAVLKKWIGEEFGVKNLQVEIGRYLLEQKNEFLENYTNDNKDVKDSEVKEMGYSFNMDETTHLMVAYQSPKILTLAQFFYTYTGGAHGNFGTTFSSYDLVSNRKMKLLDILTPAGKNQLPALLVKYIRKIYNIKPGESLSEVMLFENTIAPNDNFYVTGKGIGFNYVPYEIAAYAAGEINIFIPFSELSSYLTPGFRKLLE